MKKISTRIPIDKIIHYGILRQGIENKMYSKAGIPAVNSLEPVTIREVVKRISEMPLLSDPGEDYLYGMNTDVVGALIEELSGQRLDLFLNERIFIPIYNLTGAGTIMNSFKIWFIRPLNKLE
jgi:hypothetical protein